MRNGLTTSCVLPAVTLLLFSVVANAGSVTGTITFEGQAPEMKPYDIKEGADPHCLAVHKEKPIVNEALVLGPGQTMANVFVQISKGLPQKDHPVPAEPAVLTQEGCRYAPHVFAVQAGQTLKVLNPDGILHNVHYLPKVNRGDNRAMPATMKEFEIVFDKPEVGIPFKCDIHSWMMAYCIVVEHPYWSITKEDGVYTIDGLDPGEYEVSAWHERLGTRTATVTVKEGEAAKVDFVFSRERR